MLQAPEFFAVTEHIRRAELVCREQQTRLLPLEDLREPNPHLVAAIGDLMAAEVSLRRARANLGLAIREEAQIDQDLGLVPRPAIFAATRPAATPRAVVSA